MLTTKLLFLINLMQICSQYISRGTIGAKVGRWEYDFSCVVVSSLQQPLMDEFMHVTCGWESISSMLMTSPSQCLVIRFFYRFCWVEERAPAGWGLDLLSWSQCNCFFVFHFLLESLLYFKIILWFVFQWCVKICFWVFYQRGSESTHASRPVD